MKLFTSFFLAGIFLVPLFSPAQMAFQKNFDVANDDEFLCGISTLDGGYLACGYSSGSPYGGLAVKMDNSGAVQWSRTVGGVKISHALQTNWGAYYLGGGNVVSSNYQFYLTKIDANGMILWSKCYGKNAEPDELHSLARTPDGGLIMSGYADTINGAGFKPIAYVIKVDSNGVLQWSKYIGGTQGEEFFAAKPVSTGGYLCAGYTASYASGVGTEAYLVRLDNNGNILWAKSFGQNQRFDRIYDFQEYPGVGFYFSGEGLYNATIDNIFLAKTDTSGNFRWQKNYEEYDGAWTLLKTQDNNLLIGGYYINQSLGLYNDSYLIKTDTSGNISWSKEYGAPGVDDKLFTVAECADAGFFIAGSNYGASNGRSSWCVKTNSLGQSGCRDSVVTIPVTTIPIVTYTGGNANAEYYSTNLGIPGQLTANMAATVYCSGPTGEDGFNVQGSEFNVFPNPANDVVNIFAGENSEITIVDMQGRVVMRKNIPAGKNEIDIAEFSEGIYFLIMRNGNKMEEEKLLIVSK
ncbi:MAG: T9SS type A sorting domain-containing protein [Bacteroidetes bacterium]|nr:T9SS type A sorting domain-containing protein [Bacteroidota bacterium]